MTTTSWWPRTKKKTTTPTTTSRRELGPVVPAAEEEDDDDDELLSPDDVEADLDRILKDRMVTVEEEEDEDEADEPDERGDPAGASPAQASRRAALLELLPAGAVDRAGLPGGRRRLPDLQLIG